MSDSFPPDTLDEVEAELAQRAERSLRSFVRQAWHVLEPGTAFVPGWHLDAIIDHLEAVSRSEARNLLVNLPPRHMKSLALSVFWPVWEWVSRPQRRWLFASYALSLSVRDSLKCRRLITSPWFQRRWSDRFRLTGDQNAKMRFENDRTGYRIATSVGGAATGEGGDVVAVDDAHNLIETESRAVREATLLWWDQTMSTRLNDPKTGARVIVMQRLHELDLSGHVLQQGGYVHLCLPAEFEPSRRCVTEIGWQDPRTAEGELLWPARVGPAEIADFKRRLGPVGYAGQFQQRPAPAEGARFREGWFRYYRREDGGTGGRGDVGREDDTGTRRRGDAEKIGSRSASTLSGAAGRPPSAAIDAGTCPELVEAARPELAKGSATGGAWDDIRARRGVYVLLDRDGKERDRVRVDACDRFAVMDPAGTEASQNQRACYTVIQVWDATPQADMVLVHQYRRQVQTPDAADEAVRIAEGFEIAYLGIEREGLGLGLVQTVRRRGVAVKALVARGSKEARSETAEIRMAAGTVYFPQGSPLLEELLPELLHFPNSEHCDQVDALAHAAIEVQRRTGVVKGMAAAAPESNDGEPEGAESDEWPE